MDWIKQLPFYLSSSKIIPLDASRNTSTAFCLPPIVITSIIRLFLPVVLGVITPTKLTITFSSVPILTLGLLLMIYCIKSILFLVHRIRIPWFAWFSPRFYIVFLPIKPSLLSIRSVLWLLQLSVPHFVIRLLLVGPTFFVVALRNPGVHWSSFPPPCQSILFLHPLSRFLGLLI